jgi:hypothetical protein
MSDNFNLREYLTENQLGPFAKAKINEALPPQIIDRMDALAPQRDLALAFEYLDAVAQELDDEGFDQADIIDYIYMKMAEYYGKPRS